jgi:hypothetical protein
VRLKEGDMKGQTEPRRRRLTYANIVATLALFIAISGGTAFAASKLITGKQIAKGTITAANIKKNTLSSKLFAKGVLQSGPKGATGSQGPAGPAGPTGATGATGAPGSAVAYGAVVINSVGNPVLQAGAVGFTSVTSPGANEYCLNLPANVNGAYPVLSNLGGGNTATLTIPAPEQCPGGLEVGNPSGPALTNGTGFSIMIP